MDTRETVADILAEMRGHLGQRHDAWYTLEAWRELCDRIEAAHRREVVGAKTEATTPGNAAAMREALEAVVECAKGGCLTIRESAMDKVLNALSAPPRNCDMGTAKEQAQRFRKFCWSYRTISMSGHTSCNNCPIQGNRSCQLPWAQMPYEAAPAREGGQK